MGTHKTRKPTTRERTRAQQAVEMRKKGLPFDVAAPACGYRTVSACKMAVSRLLARIEVEGVADYRRVHSARLESLVAAHWDKATTGRDPVAAGVVMRALDSLARLWGVDAAQRHIVSEGIDAETFAKQAAELVEILAGQDNGKPAARVLVDRIDGLPALLSTEQRAELYAEEPQESFDPNWSNIGGPGIDVEDIEPEAEPAVVVVERSEADTEEVVEVEAEIVAELAEVDNERGGCGCEGEVIMGDPMPRSQFRVPASAVWGRARGVSYDALRGWTPR